jgi:hypothetical protein
VRPAAEHQLEQAAVEHGLLAGDNDDAGIAGRILDLLANPDRSRSLAARAFASCQPYEWSQVRDGWLAVYRQVLAPESGRQLVRLVTASAPPGPAADPACPDGR